MGQRSDRIVIEHARAMRYGARLPRALWGEAVSHAVGLKKGCQLVH